MGKRSTGAPVDMSWKVEDDAPKQPAKHRAVVIGAWLEEPKAAPEPRSARSHVATLQRDPVCVAAWPEAHSFGYDPRCCRFPKSCSADIVPPLS